MESQVRQYSINHPYRWIRLLSLLIVLSFGNVTEAQSIQKSEKAPANVQSESSGGKVNINTATEEELTRLPGIGPSKASAIIKLREQMGKFTQIESLMKIRGIGRKTLRKLRPMLTLSGKTTLPAKSTNKNKNK